MKRRTAKPFTVEIKTRSRRREMDATSGVGENPASDEPVVGRDLRFRDADTLFRVGFAEPPEAPAPMPPPPSSIAAFAPAPTPAEPPRRILVDLVAEAAMSEAAQAALPEPRRRGRPPKMNGATASHPAKRRGRPPNVHRVVELPQPIVEIVACDMPAAVNAVLHIAASQRRRAARDTSHLPRGERWKRRLPKVCW